MYQLGEKYVEVDQILHREVYPDATTAECLTKTYGLDTQNICRQIFVVNWHVQMLSVGRNHTSWQVERKVLIL